jgi:hypothetical protein
VLPLKGNCFVTVNIHRQGSAAFVTIPVRPGIVEKSRRYTLKELLRGATPRNITNLKRQTTGALDGVPVGRELT